MKRILYIISAMLFLLGIIFFISCSENIIIGSGSSPSTFFEEFDLGLTDLFQAVVEAPDGTIIAGGTAWLISIDSSGLSPDTTIIYQGLLVKYSPAGDTIWTSDFGETDRRVLISAIEPAWNGGYLAVGSNGPMAPADDIFLQKVLEHGEADWSYRSSASRLDHINLIAQTPDSNYLIAGMASGSMGPAKSHLCKIDQGGAVLWDTIIYMPDTNLITEAIVTTANNEMIILSSIRPQGNDNSAIDIRKLSLAGATLFEKKIKLPDNHYVHNLTLLADNKIKIVGIVNSHSQNAYWMMWTDSLGTIEGSQYYNRAGDFWIYNSYFTSDGGAVLCGFSSNGGLISRLDSEGGLVWEKEYGANIEFHSIIEYSGGGYVAAGYQKGSNINAILIKVDEQGNVNSD